MAVKHSYYLVIAAQTWVLSLHFILTLPKNVCFSVTLLGEKLSKQQLQHSNIIKKLRVKEKEADTKIIKQQKKINDQEEELKHLQQV